MQATAPRVAVVSSFPLVAQGLSALLTAPPSQVSVVDRSATGWDVAVYDLSGLGAGDADLEWLEPRSPVIGLDLDGVVRRRPDLACRLGATVTAEVTSQQLVTYVGLLARDEAPACRPLPAGLTQREHEFLTHVAQGLTNAQVADAMFVSANTVKTYTRLSYRKIGARNRAQAVLWAMSHGLSTRDISSWTIRRPESPRPVGQHVT